MLVLLFSSHLQVARPEGVGVVCTPVLITPPHFKLPLTCPEFTYHHICQVRYLQPCLRTNLGTTIFQIFLFYMDKTHSHYSHYSFTGNPLLLRISPREAEVIGIKSYTCWVWNISHMQKQFEEPHSWHPPHISLEHALWLPLPSVLFFGGLVPAPSQDGRGWELISLPWLLLGVKVLFAGRKKHMWSDNINIQERVCAKPSDLACLHFFRSW